MVKTVYHICEVSATIILQKGEEMYEKYEKLLVKKGITSSQVSKDTGIGENILSYWKTGRSSPKVDKLVVLANYFNVPVTYFLE